MTNEKTKYLRLDILLLILLGGLSSCDTTTNDKGVQTETKLDYPIINLSGQVFNYAPELDTVNCESYGECDCCSGTFLFLNDHDFLTINVCEADNDYCKGTYEIANENLILHYDSLAVEKNYNWEKETDTTRTVTTEYFIKQSKTSATTAKLDRVDCKKNICFITGGKEPVFVTLDKKSKIADLTKQLKEDGIWDKLEIK